MSDDIKELLSAYLDGELDEGNLDKLKRNFQANPQLNAKVNRYAFISESLKNQSSHQGPISIVDQVSQVLDSEPTILSPKNLPVKSSLPTWVKSVSGFAIAATVATVAILNLGDLIQNNNSLEKFPVTVDVKPTVVNPFDSARMPKKFSQRASTKWVTGSYSPEVEAELNQFLINHSEYATQTGIPGLLPYTTFVVYDKE